MKTFGKVALGGCLTIVAIPVLILVAYGIHRMLQTPEERAAEDRKYQERRAAADKVESEKRARQEAEKERLRQAELDKGRAEAEAFVRKLTVLRRQLPRPAELAEKKCPASVQGKITYLPADYQFFTQFRETGFQATSNSDSPLWYRANLLDAAQKALAANAPEWDTPALARAGIGFDQSLYVAVFLAERQHWPKLHEVEKKFEGGSYRGWVILVDAKSGDALCQTLFEATSSERVTDRYVNIGPRGHGIKVGDNLTKAINDDFTNNFWAAANSAIGRMRTDAPPR